MSEYGVQQSSRPVRQPSYGYSSHNQREAAFSDIFGAAPGRSQTMTTTPPSLPQDRAQTMSSQHTITPQPNRMQSPPSRQPPIRPQQNGYGPPNGFPPQAPGQRPPGGLVQPQPAMDYLPQSTNERRSFTQPPRTDSRQPPPTQLYTSRPIPNRGPPGAALNSDPFRSRSMAPSFSPNQYNGPPNGYSQPAPGTAFRQQPYLPPASRTTAQGRHIPERVDERAMSMTAWTPDRDHSQTMSGRVIPNRRRENSTEGTDKVPQQTTNGFGPSPSITSASSDRTVTMNSISSVSSVDNSGRTMSMASTTSVPSDRTMSMQSRPSAGQNVGSSGSTTTTRAKTPLVYPALLSRVAQVFVERINAGDRTTDLLKYNYAFTGREAVDLLAYIIRTNDRNLALILGRALDAQKLFHDVAYEHRLRDSPTEVYQFKDSLNENPATQVHGVVTLLTECYSPTCSRDHLCYSIACPRRLEQQARLNLKPNGGLRREASQASLRGDDSDEQKLWINTVSKEVADSVDEKEKKRQEVISEIMYTERDFVKDLEYLRDCWMKPLRSTNPMHPSPIPENYRERFVREVFSNCLDVLAVNSKLAESLTRRQQENPVVRSVGDIFLQYIPRFEPFIVYGSGQLFGKYKFEKERTRNSAFSSFVDETERLKESRKLELNGYLTKPTTRLARYPLLLEGVLKYTAEGNSDREDIPRAVALIRGFLTRVNEESGKAENKFNLFMLNSTLSFEPADRLDLKLLDDNRQLIIKMPLKRGPTDTSEISVYLFDHAVMLAKHKTVNKIERIKAWKKPIPLELLVIAQMDEILPKPVTKRPSSSLTLGAKNGGAGVPRTSPAQRDVFPITFRHLGKGGYEHTLWSPTQGQRRKLLELIDAQQTKLRERNNVFTKHILCDNFFTSTNRVNCFIPTDGGRKLVYGTDSGIYIQDRRPKAEPSRPRQVLDVSGVTQIDMLEEYQLLLVLANKTLLSYPLEVLDSTDNPTLKRPKKIQSHTNFFRTGVCLGRHLVCCAKSSSISTTVKVFEPMDTLSKGRRQRGGFSQLFQSTQDSLKPFKEFYVQAESTSIHFLKSSLCVATSRGFEVVSLQSLERQSLLDDADTSLDFVKEEKETRPLHIERMNGEFLLNYSEFSFFVDRNGWRARQDWKIVWEGNPNGFALSYPYILAFEPSFVDIRDVETSACVHIMTASNIRLLHASTQEIIYAYEDDGGQDVVASLDFWEKKDGAHASTKVG
ncbi:RHO1 GDP-GTP exchange protein 2 [Agyrium rufum]|nr:RHO1 GDP-GTP exchange protein 2 [Agyrium rufum]